MSYQTDQVSIEPTARGFLARSLRWGIAATGRTQEEAAKELDDGIRLFEKADALLHKTTDQHLGEQK